MRAAPIATTSSTVVIQTTAFIAPDWSRREHRAFHRGSGKARVPRQDGLSGASFAGASGQWRCARSTEAATSSSASPARPTRRGEQLPSKGLLAGCRVSLSNFTLVPDGTPDKFSTAEQRMPKCALLRAVRRSHSAIAGSATKDPHDASLAAAILVSEPPTKPVYPIRPVFPVLKLSLRLS